MIYAMLLNMKTQGWIAACRMISQYNLDRHDAVHNLMNIVLKQIRVEGFPTSDRFYLYLKFLELVLPLIREGKIGYVEDITFRLKSGPSTHSWALLRSERWEVGGGSGPRVDDFLFYQNKLCYFVVVNPIFQQVRNGNVAILAIYFQTNPSD